jgi:hypothetical protein
MLALLCLAFVTASDRSALMHTMLRGRSHTYLHEGVSKRSPSLDVNFPQRRLTTMYRVGCWSYHKPPREVPRDELDGYMEMLVGWG